MFYKFSCTKCGECCRWDGVVKLTSPDIVRISAYLELSIPEFLKKYTRKDNYNNRVLINRKDAGFKEDPEACVFLEENLCKIHEVVPEQCKDYPTKYDQRCPGFEPVHEESDGEVYMDLKTMKKAMQRDSDDFDKRVMENLFKSLEKGTKALDVASSYSLSSPDSGMDVFLDQKTARVKIANLDDLFSFHRISADMLVHKSNKELWSIKKDDKGEVFIERHFDADSGEPLKV